MLLPKKQGNPEDRVLIVGQYKNAYIYNINQGTTTPTGTVVKNQKYNSEIVLNI